MIVVELGQEHRGRLYEAIALIAAFRKADVLKFQIHVPEVEEALDCEWRVPVGGYNSRYDYWRETSFPLEDWIKIATAVRDFGCEFLASTFSPEGMDLYHEIQKGVPDLRCAGYKIASGELLNFPFHKCRKASRVYISNGLFPLEKVGVMVLYAQTGGLVPLEIACQSAYDSGLTPLSVFDPECHYGLSYHYPGVGPGLSALSRGAEYVEVHGTLNREGRTPDAGIALLPEEVGQLVEYSAYLRGARNLPFPKIDAANERLFAQRSYVLNAPKKAGDTILEGDVRRVRGGVGAKYPINRVLKADLEAGFYIREEHLL